MVPGVIVRVGAAGVRHRRAAVALRDSGQGAAVSSSVMDLSPGGHLRHFGGDRVLRHLAHQVQNLETTGKEEKGRLLVFTLLWGTISNTFIS